MTTANKITITRILLIPVFVMMAIYYGKSVQRGHPQDWERFLTIFIFLVAAASDGIDGYIARHYNQRSELGVILDPIADKGLLLAAIVTLTFSNWTYELPLWFPVLVIARDGIIIIGSLLLHFFYGKVEIKPSWLGKTATVFQMLAIALVLLQLRAFETEITLLGQTIQFEFLDIPVLLAGLFTLISGIGYVMNGIAQLHASGHGNANT